MVEFFQHRPKKILKIFASAQNRNKGIILWVEGVGLFSEFVSKIFFGSYGFKKVAKKGSKMAKNRYF